MPQLRVYWIAQNYPSRDVTAGAFHRVQVEMLAQQHVHVEVLTPVPWVPPLAERVFSRWALYAALPLAEVMGEITIHRPRYLALPREAAWAAPHAAMAHALAGLRLPAPDLVHAQPAYPHGLAGLQLARAWRVPLVLTLQGTDVNAYPHLNALAGRRFRAALRGADAVTAVSNSLAAEAERLSGVRPRVLPRGVRLTAFERLPAKRRARAELGLPADGFLLLFVGVLTAEKGVRELLTALRALHDEGVVGVFVGPGPLLGAVRATRGAIAVDWQPHERVPLFLAASDVAVLPSYMEGMPNVLVEAGAAGTPVIASAVGGVPELLADDRGLLVPARSAEAIVAAVRATRAQPSAAAARAERLRRYVHEAYDAARNIQGLISLYDEVMAISAVG
jgi:teichuronic acid biosynthesis glycosyltransferase TuaC